MPGLRSMPFRMLEQAAFGEFPGLVVSKIELARDRSVFSGFGFPDIDAQRGHARCGGEAENPDNHRPR